MEVLKIVLPTCNGGVSQWCWGQMSAYHHALLLIIINIIINALCIINTWQLQDWWRARHYKCLVTEIIAIQIRKPTENNGSAKMLTRTEVRVRLFQKWKAKNNLNQPGPFSVFKKSHTNSWSKKVASWF